MKLDQILEIADLSWSLFGEVVYLLARKFALLLALIADEEIGYRIRPSKLDHACQIYSPPFTSHFKDRSMAGKEKVLADA